MSRSEINKSSLAFIRSINEALGRRLLEAHLMSPDGVDKERDDEYPLYKEKNVERYGRYNPKEKQFDASSPSDLNRFFAGLTTQ